MRKIFSNNTSQIILIIASAIIATSLLLRTGLPNGHDTYAHTTYSKLFSHALSQGQFPVRWVEHAWVGFGQPLFNYYQVGFFYLVSFIHLLLPNITTAIKASTIFIWIMGAIFLFLFTRKYGQHSAVVAFIVYLFSPYLLLDIFVRSSFPELTALSLIPGVFIFINYLIYNFFYRSNSVHQIIQTIYVLVQCYNKKTISCFIYSYTITIFIDKYAQKNS